MPKKNVIKFFFNEGNWGDKFSPILVEMISGEKPELFPMKEKFVHQNEIVYLTVGSILKFADSNTIVWGSGFIREEDSLQEKPLKICAVRGPKTREKVLAQGIDCPEVYGDPILLLPKFYKPKLLTRKKLGIIPHYVDQDNAWLNSVRNNPDIRIIDIKGDYFQVIDEIFSCDVIASSSLHGLILPDAYGIPSVWLKFSDKLWGGNWKFFDYFESVGRIDKEPLLMTDQITVEDILKRVNSYKIKIDLDRLLQACPFKK